METPEAATESAVLSDSVRPRTVTVTGHGVVRVVPDVAVVRLAAVARATTVAEAFTRVGAVVRGVVDSAGRELDPGAIAADDVQVWPAHDTQGRPDGFEARHTVRLRCPSLDVAGDLLGRLLAESEGLLVDGVSLEVADDVEARTAAREAAYADAVARAEQLAALSGARLGEVLAVVEPSGLAAPGIGVGAMRAEAAFQPGERDLDLALTVTFALV